MQFNFYPFDNITIDMNLLLMYLLAGVCLYDLLVGPFFVLFNLCSLLSNLIEVTGLSSVVLSFF